MGLSVSLLGPEKETECVCTSCGHTHVSRDREVLYSRHITHNLTPMADAAGIYKVLWRPEEAGISKACHLIEPLELGLRRLVSAPEEFSRHNPPNGWGSYGGLVSFVSSYLEACKKFPEAEVHASR